MAKVKVFQKQVKLQGQGHKVKKSFIFNGLKVMTKVKVSVHAANTDADTDAHADARAMTLAPLTFIPAR